MSSYGPLPEPAALDQVNPAVATGAAPSVAVPPSRPVPPPGPGVVPPFAAPPTDGLRRRMWLGLTAWAVALVVVCVGGLGGCIALAVTAEKARTNAATNVVTEFLTAWEHDNYAAAYQLTCDDLKNQVNLADFTGELSARQLSGFTLGDPDLTTSAAIVPVRLEFVEGGFDNERFRVVVDRENKSVVCGTVA